MTTPYEKNILVTTIGYDTISTLIGYFRGLLGTLTPDGPFGSIGSIFTLVYSTDTNILTVDISDIADQPYLWEWTATEVRIDGTLYGLTWNGGTEYSTEVLAESPFDGASGSTTVYLSGTVKKDLKSEHGLSAPLFEVTGV